MKYAGLVVFVAGCVWSRVGFAETEKISARHLPNCIRVTEKVISGGQPEGEAAFAELRELGVKTIVSVDGAKPEAELAKKYGLRYVHLPIGYDGVPDERVRELAKAVRDLPGPIYVHCHHGKHRGPAAAASACVALGTLTTADALGVLKTAGTGPNYVGLFASVQSAKKLEPAEVDRLKVSFREAVAPPALTEAMVAIDRTHDHLKAIANASRLTPPEQPDLEPVQEATLLREQFAELQRAVEVQKRSRAFQEAMHDGEQTAARLETVLRSREKSNAARRGARTSDEQLHGVSPPLPRRADTGNERAVGSKGLVCPRHPDVWRATLERIAEIGRVNH